MQPLAILFVFYLNYLYLAPKYFVAGKHRYDLLINVILVVSLGIFLHVWSEFTNDIFPIHTVRQFDIYDDIAIIVRDTINLSIFAAGSTALALARRYVTSDQKLKASEAARSRAELYNLRSQINPHFLLNTLNNIYALTVVDQKQAQDAIMQLSKMLRHMLYDNQEDAVPLSDEIQFLENYISLMKIRLSQNVEIIFNHQKCKAGVMIAPLIFISLIENAFKHGISLTVPSFIHIDMTASDKEITCRIENSNHPKSLEDRSGHGIGLNQVERRLELAYPNHYIWEKGLSDDGKSYLSIIKIKL
jgi:sensor histidine kinase YesM